MLEGRDLKNGEFKFELKDSEGKVVGEATNDKDGKVKFAAITYDAVGEYTYTITEVDNDLGGVTYDEGTVSAKVTVTDDGEGQLHATVVYGAKKEFINTYVPAPTSASFEMKKSLTGRDLKAEEFSFSLLDKDGNLVENVKNAADGSVKFSELEFEEAGTYKYTVSETVGSLGGVTYDTSVLSITVEVTDDLEGHLVAEVTYPDGKEFKNTYKASGSFTPETTKILEGKDLEAGEFSFELKDADGKVIETVKNDAAGKVTFSKINFTEADEGKVFNYTITEVKGDENFVTYDEHELTVKATVTDRGDGTLGVTAEYGGAPTFTNVYKELFGDLEIIKNLPVFNATNGKQSFVYSVVATLDGEKVYDSIVTLDFSKPGTSKAKIEGKIPVGSKVTVTEIYTGASYEATVKTAQETEIIPTIEGTASVTFENKPTEELTQGYSVLNEYDYTGAEGWVHNKNKTDSAE